VTGVRGGRCLTDRIRARRGGHVSVLTGYRDAGRLVDPRLAGLQQAIAIRVAVDKRRAEIVRRIAWRAVVVTHPHVRQRHVARIGHRIGPGDGTARGHQRARRRVRVLAVGRLLDVDRRLGAKVVIRIGVRQQRPADGSGSGCRAQVLVLSRDRKARRRVEPHFARFQQIVVVAVAHVESAAEDRRGIDPRLVVHDRHARDGFIAEITDLIGPSDRAAHRDQRPCRCVIVRAVGQFDELNLAGNVERKIGATHRRADGGDDSQLIIQTETGKLVALYEQELDRANACEVGRALAINRRKVAELHPLEFTLSQEGDCDYGLGCVVFIRVDGQGLKGGNITERNLQHERILSPVPGQVDAIQARRVDVKMISGGSIPIGGGVSAGVRALLIVEQTVVVFIHHDGDVTGTQECIDDQLPVAAENPLRRHGTTDRRCAAGRQLRLQELRLFKIVHQDTRCPGGVARRDDDGDDRGHRGWVDIPAGLRRLNDKIGTCREVLKAVIPVPIGQPGVAERVRPVIEDAVCVRILV